jgi:predicted dinucleotide-binding enzyme
LLDQFGFDPVDAGALADSWRFERAKPVYCIAFDRAGMLEGLAAAQRDVELPHGSWRH